MRLCDFPILTFDTYGTLIDWETGIWDALQPLCCASGRPADSRGGSRSLRAGGIRLPSGQSRPALRQPPSSHPPHAGPELGLRSPMRPRASALASRSGTGRPFADAVESLAYLKRHHRLITLTNCDRASYRGSSARLGNPWDAILPPRRSARTNRRWPTLNSCSPGWPRTSAVTLGSILHVAQSLFHDHVPAKAIGLTTAWIDRRAGTRRRRDSTATGGRGTGLSFQKHGGTGRPASRRTGL